MGWVAQLVETGTDRAARHEASMCWRSALPNELGVIGELARLPWPQAKQLLAGWVQQTVPARGCACR